MQSNESNKQNDQILFKEIMNGNTVDHGSIVVIFTIANIIFVPSIPFLPLSFGIPVIIILLGFITGKILTLPSFIGNRSISRKNIDKFTRFGNKISFLASKNRASSVFVNQYTAYFIYIMGILLTLGICVPVPIFNIPSAFCMLFLAMGLAKNDGLISMAGAIMGIPALIFLYAGPVWIINSELWREAIS